MLQDNGMEILRHAAKYLHQRWLDEGREDDGDYAAINLLKWMFTGEGEQVGRIRYEDDTPVL